MNLGPYIYAPDKSIGVCKKTEVYFNNNPELKNRIEELGWIYHTISIIIPQNLENFWSGHSFPFRESWEELQISFNLVCFGLYKQAFVSLRSGLELGLLSVYYNINDEGHKTVKEWLHSKDTADAKTPRADKIWSILLSNKNIKTFNDLHDLRQTFNGLSYLHNYVHTKGAKYSNSMGLSKSNFQTFEVSLIEKWLKGFTDIIALVCSLHLLKYPVSVIRFDYSSKFGIDIPSFGGLEEPYIDRIAKILPSGYLKDIERIAEQDPEAQNIIAEISAFPDKTEEEVEEQVRDLEKMFIQNGEGFTLWLERQERILEMMEETDFDEKTKIRIEVLRKWATENNCLNPKAHWGGKESDY